MSIGENIKRIRIMYDLKQQDIANIVGVTDRAVSFWERDIKTPRMGAIQKIADHFGLKKSDIIEGNVLDAIHPAPKEKKGDILDIIFDDQPAMLRAIRSIKADDGLVIDESNKKFIQRAILLALKEAKNDIEGK